MQLEQKKTSIISELMDDELDHFNVNNNITRTVIIDNNPRLSSQERPKPIDITAPLVQDINEQSPNLLSKFDHFADDKEVDDYVFFDEDDFDFLDDGYKTFIPPNWLPRHSLIKGVLGVDAKQLSGIFLVYFFNLLEMIGYKLPKMLISYFNARNTLHSFILTL